MTKITTMKIYIFIIAATLLLLSCKNHNVNRAADATRAATDTVNYTTIEWIETTKNIGVVKFGDKTEIEFRFKNTGDKPLWILNAQPGCHCTIADYPKEAIAPNGEGTVKAGYDTNEGSAGEFIKNIVITSNTKGSTTTNLIFKGEAKKL